MEPIRQIERLERRLKTLTVVLFVSVGGLAILSLWPRSATGESLRVRQITVVDAHGTERVWIGAPVPDPIIQGERRQRSGPISGLVLLDAKGNERAGFATSDLLEGEATARLGRVGRRFSSDKLWIAEQTGCSEPRDCVSVPWRMSAAVLPVGPGCRDSHTDRLNLRNGNRRRK